MSRTFIFNAGHIAERKVRDEYVLIPVSSDYGKTGTLLDLNPVAAQIWEQAKEGVSEEAICHAIAADCDVPSEEVAIDVKTVLDELVGFGALIEHS